MSAEPYRLTLRRASPVAARPLDGPTLAAAMAWLWTQSGCPALVEWHAVERTARRVVQLRRPRPAQVDAGVDALNVHINAATVGLPVTGAAPHLVAVALWLALLDPCPPWATDLRTALEAIDRALGAYAGPALVADTGRAADAAVAGMRAGEADGRREGVA